MITASMNKLEINQQMWAVAEESSVVNACTQKFFKSFRKLPKGRVVMTRKFFFIKIQTKPTFFACHNTKVFRGVTKLGFVAY